jgi:hypothetical protein
MLPSLLGARPALGHLRFADLGFVNSVPTRLLGLLVIALALPFTAAAWYILRHPGWRREGWWSRHPGLTRAFVGPLGPIASEPCLV